MAAPILNAIAAGRLIDTIGDDDFADLTGQFEATDADDIQGDITFTVTTGAGGAAVEDTTETGFTHRVDGRYGSLFYNGKTGHYKYVPDDDAINAIVSDTTETFSVTASDPDETSAAGTFTINIEAVNDRPVFNPIPTDLIIAEDADGTGTAVNIGSAVTATADTGETIAYTLKSPAPANFEIDGATGQIRYTGSSLNYGTTPSIELTVIADDGTYQTEQIVTIFVTDVQPDGLPFASVGEAFEFILPALTSGQTYTLVSITDDFARTVTTSSWLSFDAATGTLSGTPLAADEDVGFDVTIRRSDNEIFNYYILVNKALTAPIFDGDADMAGDQPILVNLPENAAPTASADVYLADLEDYVENIDDFVGFTFTFANSVPTSIRDSFTIREGLLFYTGVARDYEANADVWTFDVVFTSDLGQQDTATVTVSLTDVVTEGRPPVFDTVPTDLTIAENQDGTGTAINIGSPVVARSHPLEATNSGEATIIYALKEGAPPNFEIDAMTGQISYTGAGLDYETERSISLTVVASNIYLTDLPASRLWIAENQDGSAQGPNGEFTDPVIIGTPFRLRLIDLPAYSDEDADDDADDLATSEPPVPVTYTLADDSPTDFAIDANGQISYTGTGLNYETTPTISLTIIASSGANTRQRTVEIAVINVVEAGESAAPRSGTAEQAVTITVTDVDSEPLILNQPQQATVQGDTAAYDSFSNIEGSFTVNADASRTASVTFSATVKEAIEDITYVSPYSLDGFTHRVTGNYGELFYNQNSGLYRYRPDQAKVNAIEAGETRSDSFIITAEATGYTNALKTLTVNFVGANEDIPATISHDITDTPGVDEFAAIAGEVGAQSLPDSVTFRLESLYVPLTLSYQTIDTTTETGFTNTIDTTYGQLFFNYTTGAYRYVPDNAAINRIAANTHIIDTFQIRASNNVITDLLINIRGSVEIAPKMLTATITDTPANDDFTEITSSGETEAENLLISHFLLDAEDFDPATISVTRFDVTISGAVTVAVADTSQTGFTHSVTGTYGTLFYHAGTGAYKYMPDNVAINALAAGASGTDEFTVHATYSLPSTVFGSNIDGTNPVANGNPNTNRFHSHTLTITVNGADEAPAPTFAAVPNDLTLAENQAGSEVAPINVGSPVTATAGGAAITYSLSGQPTGFTIVATTGQIRYEGPAFNYEALTAAQRQITFTVTATEARGDMQASQQVTISITDVNEVPTRTAAPIFNTLPTDLTTAEDTDGTGAGGAIDVGSPVTAADQAGGTVTYRIDGDAQGFEIDATSGQISYAGNSLDFETAPTITLTIVARSSATGNPETQQAVEIAVTDVNEAPEIANDALAYHQGETNIVLQSTDLLTTDEDTADTPAQLTYTITSLSSAGNLQLDAAGDGTWVNIAQSDTFTQDDVNAGRVRYVPTDPMGTTDSSFGFSVADGGENSVSAITGTLTIDVREVVDIAEPELEDRVDLDTEGTAGAKTVDTGNGVDRITTGTGNDHIIGGWGNDEINLENNNDEAGGADEIVYTFSVRNGNWVAYDGADEIRGFKRGEDKIIFQVDSAQLPGITTLQQFLIAARGADNAGLTKDDQFMVRPRFEYDADGAWISGIAFYFQDAGHYGNGKLAVGLLKIYFDERIWQDDFLDLIETPAGDENISRTTLGIRDLTVLPALLGEDSIEFRLIERPVFETVTPGLSFSESETDIDITTLTATHANGETIRYSLESPPSGFAIDETTGVLSYSGPGATAGDITLTVVATASGGSRRELEVSLTVARIDEPPTSFSLSSNAESVSEDSGSQMLSTITIVDADGASGGTRNVAIIADSDIFELRDTNDALIKELWLKRNAEIDFETAQTHTIDVTVGIFRNPAAVEAYEAALEAALRAGTPPPAEVLPIVDAVALPAQTFTLTVTDAEEPPVLGPFTSHTIADTVAISETFAPITGQFDANDEDADDPDNEIDFFVTRFHFPSTDDTSRELVAAAGADPAIMSTHRIAGTYGTLYYNKDTGHYEYDPTADAAIDALREGEDRSEIFHVRAFSGTDVVGSARKIFSIAITGANEPNIPVFDSLPTLSIAEDADGTATAVDVGTIRAANQLGEAITYTLAGNAQGFAIGGTTGQITYVGSGYDYEALLPAQRTITLTVVATSSSNIETRQLVPITVTDVNEAPTFDGPPTSPTTPPFTISENVDASGQGDAITVATLSATDPEEGVTHRGITYSFAPPQGVTYTGWSIDSATGIITYTGTGLDHETTPTIELIVQAADAVDGNNVSRTATQTVTVTVTNVIEPFAFTEAPTAFTLNENMAGPINIASAFEALAPERDSETVRYGLQDENGRRPADFTIGFDTGQIQYTGAGFDYETTPSVTLTVAAFIGGRGNVQSINTDIVITIANVVEPLAFTTADRTFTLNENVAGDVDITNADFAATYGDRPTETIRYSVSGHSDFAITTSGQLQYTGTGFDYEALTTQGRQISLTITASVGSGATLATEAASVTVDIRDVDEPLAFTAAPTTLSLNENVAGNVNNVDISGGVFTAVDPDTAGTVSYSVSGSNDFAIDAATGQLQYTGAALDYETLAQSEQQISLTITATTGSGATQQTANTGVTVNIADVDEKPTSATIVWDTTTPATVDNPDTDRKLGTVNFIDDATGTNTASIAQNDFFEIRNGNELWLRPNAPFVYTANPFLQHKITLSFTTSGTGTELADQTYTVTVDKEPTSFAIIADTTSVSEDTTAATKLADIGFIDDGIGTNSFTLSDTTRFELRAARELVYVNQGGSPVLLPQGVVIPNQFELWLKAGAALDFETAQSHSVTLTPDVTGVDNPQLVAQTFTLAVTDVDEDPTDLTLSATDATLAEGSRGQKLADITVTDPDSTTNNRLTISNSEIFEIRNGNELWLKHRVLDFEDTTQPRVATVTLSVADTTTDPETLSTITTETFTLTVTDVNEAPVLEVPGSYTITDTSTRNEDFADLTGQFSATDEDAADTAATIGYSVVRPITPTQEHPFTSTVNPVADTTKTLATSVTSTHSVAGLYGTLYFNANSGHYLYDPNNDAINALEDDENAAEAFRVQAYSGTGARDMASNHRTLTINIEGADEVSLAPRFATLPTDLDIAEDADGTDPVAGAVNVGSPVTATDPTGGTISYRIDGDAQGFEIVGTTGQISYTGNSLDFETAQTINLRVVASSSNGEETEQLVPITVTNVNEAPVFDSDPIDVNRELRDPTKPLDNQNPFDPIDNPGGAIEIAENIRPMSRADSIYVARVLATDPERAVTHLGIEYGFAPPQGVTYTGWVINSGSGYIVYRGSGLDYEDESYVTNNDYVSRVTRDDGTVDTVITLRVRAQDNLDAGVRRETIQEVEIVLTDAVEPLAFTDTPPTTLSLDENVAGDVTNADITDGVFTAEYGDKPTETIRYSVTGHSDFAITASGQLQYTGTGFDYEALSQSARQISLTITASVGSDAGGDLEEITASVTVSIEDVEEAFGFTAAPTTLSLNENVAGNVNNVDISGGVFTAVDPDDSTATVTYGVTGHSDFTITTSGQLQYTGTGFDYEALTLQGRQISLMITASIGSGATLETATATVTVGIADVNDAPTAPTTPLTNPAAFELYAASPGTFSHTVSATAFSDEDTGDTLTYSAMLVQIGTDDSGAATRTLVALPDWLDFAASTRTFTLITAERTPPGGGDPIPPVRAPLGEHIIEVTATDGDGETASSDLTIELTGMVPDTETVPGTTPPDKYYWQFVPSTATEGAGANNGFVRHDTNGMALKSTFEANDLFYLDSAITSAFLSEASQEGTINGGKGNDIYLVKGGLDSQGNNEGLTQNVEIADLPSNNLRDLDYTNYNLIKFESDVSITSHNIVNFVGIIERIELSLDTNGDATTGETHAVLTISAPASGTFLYQFGDTGDVLDYAGFIAELV